MTRYFEINKKDPTDRVWGGKGHSVSVCVESAADRSKKHSHTRVFSLRIFVFVEISTFEVDEK